MKEKITKIPNCLVKIRKSRGLTQVEVAKKLGISKRTLCSYEKGERRLPSRLVEPLATILNSTADEILGIKSQKNDGRSSDIKLKKKAQYYAIFASR